MYWTCKFCVVLTFLQGQSATYVGPQEYDLLFPLFEQTACSYRVRLCSGSIQQLCVCHLCVWSYTNMYLSCLHVHSISCLLCRSVILCGGFCIIITTAAILCVVLSVLFCDCCCFYCCFKIETYWTYELCHGRYLRQYHEDKELKQVKFFCRSHCKQPASHLYTIIAAVLCACFPGKIQDSRIFSWQV